jgi:molybdenum cofactor cytidylyltransferase
MNTKSISSIIFAAGLSERMDHPKSLLFFDEKRTFLEKIVAEFQNFGCDSIYIVVNERDLQEIQNLNFKNIKLIINTRLDLGRFFSIKLGLLEALKSNSDYFFFHNIDNPFLNQNILNQLVEVKDEKFFIIPYYHGNGGHPILIPRKIAKYLKKESSIDSNLKEELSKFGKIKIEIDDEKILANINTKEIYTKYFGQ